MLTVQQVAKMLACSTVTVTKIVRDGRLRAIDISDPELGKSRYRFREEDVVEFMNTPVEVKPKFVPSKPEPEKFIGPDGKEYVNLADYQACVSLRKRGFNV